MIRKLNVRVRFSAEGLAFFVTPPDCLTGTVRGFHRSGMVIVERDERETMRWPQDFWEVIA